MVATQLSTPSFEWVQIMFLLIHKKNIMISFQLFSHAISGNSILSDYETETVVSFSEHL